MKEAKIGESMKKSELKFLICEVIKEIKEKDKNDQDLDYINYFPKWKKIFKIFEKNGLDDFETYDEVLSSFEFDKFKFDHMVIWNDFPCAVFMNKERNKAYLYNPSEYPEGHFEYEKGDRAWTKLMGFNRIEGSSY
jgi:hypothetical protein